MILLAIAHGQPRELGLIPAIQYFIEHRVDVVRRRTAYLLNKAQEREHILEGYLTALDLVMASVLSPPGINRLWNQVRFVNETATWSKRAGEWFDFFKIRACLIALRRITTAAHARIGHVEVLVLMNILLTVFVWLLT